MGDWLVIASTARLHVGTLDGSTMSTRRANGVSVGTTGAGVGCTPLLHRQFISGAYVWVSALGRGTRQPASHFSVSIRPGPGPEDSKGSDAGSSRTSIPRR